MAAPTSISVEAESAVNIEGSPTWTRELSDDGGIEHQHGFLKAAANATSGGAHGFATYPLRLRTGSYQIFVRGKSATVGSNSALISTELTQSPGVLGTVQIVSFGTDGKYRWGTCGACTIQVPASGAYEIRLAVREPSVQVDGIVLVPGAPLSRSDGELDAMTGYFEAEDPDMAQSIGLESFDHSLASGGKRLRDFREIGDTLEFAGFPAGNELLIRYSLAGTQARQASLYFIYDDGEEDVDTVVFTPTDPTLWDKYATTSVRILPRAAPLEQPVGFKLQVDADDRQANMPDPVDPQSPSVQAPTASIDRVSIGEPGRACLVTSQADWDAAVAWMQRGDSIVVASGNVIGRKTLTVPVDKQGSPDRPIVIRSEVQGGVNFGDAAAIVVSGNWITLQDLTFARPVGSPFTQLPPGCNGDVDEMVSCRGISLLGAHGRVTNVLFDSYYPIPAVGGYSAIAIYGQLASSLESTTRPSLDKGVRAPPSSRVRQ